MLQALQEPGDEAATPLGAVFCDDNRFILREDGRVYSEAQFGYRLWQRYLEVFDKLTVVGRKHAATPGPPDARLNLSSRPGVSFVFAPDLASTVNLLRHHSGAVSLLTSVIAQSDAVIARLPSLLGLRAVPIAERLGKPWAVEACACPWDQLWNYGTWQGKAYAPVYMQRMRQVVARSPFTLYVSRDFLQRRYPTRGVTAVASNVEIARPEPAVLARRLARIRAGRQRLVLGMIGSIRHRHKGLGTAIAGLARVRAQLPDFELRVLGPGDRGPWQREAQRHGLGDHLRFDGILPSGQPVLAWLDEIDIYVQPSFQEGLPRALVEAMSRACPAVGSTAGGIPELLPCGCLHRPGDDAGFGALIRRACHDAAWQCAQAERNFESAKAYASEILAERRTQFWGAFARHALAVKMRSGSVASETTSMLSRSHGRYS